MHKNYVIGKHAPPHSTKFRLHLNNNKPKKRNNSGKKGNFLLDFEGLPDHMPNPPEVLILFLVKSILLKYNNKLQIELTFPPFMEKLQFEYPSTRLISQTREFQGTNSWLVFRSYYTSSITQEVSSQTDLSSILSICWKNEKQTREIWSLYNRFYRNFKESAPEIKMNFRMWLNLKYNFPKDFFIVQKHVCNKFSALFETDVNFTVSQMGNYEVPGENIKENDLFGISFYIINKSLENKNKIELLESILAKVDNEIVEKISNFN